MTVYFPDLSPYDYYAPAAFPGVFTIGWLDQAHPYETGDVAAGLVRKLTSAMIGTSSANVHVNQIRGVRPCGLCGMDEFEDRRLRIGSTEVWIPGAQEVYYASPSMLLHYITAHRYLPPEPFRAALTSLDLSKPYRAQAEYERLAAVVMA